MFTGSSPRRLSSYEQRWQTYVKRIPERDTAALESLYDETSRVLFSLAYRILNAREDAEEVILDGSVANSWGGRSDRLRSQPALRSDAEDCVDELALGNGIALGDPADLTFADCMHCLIPLYGSTSALDRSEPEACRNPLLDEPVVLLDDVVQVRSRAATTAATQFTGLLQISDRRRIGWMAVHVDDSRRRAAAG